MLSFFVLCTVTNRKDLLDDDVASVNVN